MSLLSLMKPAGSWARQRRRLKGKSDSVDAEAAARAALARDMVAVPKSGTGSVEAIRALHVPRNSAMKARTQVANQIHTLIDTAPDQLREQLIGRKIPVLVTEMARWRPSAPTDPTSAHRYSLHTLARRWQALTDELADLDLRLTELVNETAPELVAVHGVGVETAVTLLIAAGDNAERLGHERSFVALCGVSPSTDPPGGNETTVSTVEGNGTRTGRCGVSRSCECRATPPPARTSKGAPAKASRRKQSSAVSSATSPEKSSQSSNKPLDNL